MQDFEYVDRTRRDYDGVAQAYDDLVRHDDSSTHVLSTAMITAFAELVRASDSGAEVLDVGCGPGQWTEHLHELGVPVSGIDLSPTMVAVARSHRPDLKFEVGSVLDLPTASGSAGGVLAHFSLIHLPPHLMPAALAELARVAAPGAPLLVGFQMTDGYASEGWVEYGHRASPAYRWTLDALAELLSRQGFSEIARMRVEPLSEGNPPPGYLLTRRRVNDR